MSMSQDKRNLAAPPIGRCTQARSTRTALSEGLLQDVAPSSTRWSSKRVALLVPVVGLLVVALFSFLPRYGGESAVQLPALAVPTAGSHSQTSINTPSHAAKGAQRRIAVRPQAGPLLTCVAKERIKSRRASTNATQKGGSSHEVRSVAAAPPKIQARQIIRPVEATNPIKAAQLELVANLDDWAESDLMPILLDPKDSWQPQDLLPDPSSPDWLDQLAEIQKLTKDIPDEVLVALVGDMITEEALPTYQTMLNTLEGTKDETGADAHPWARWTRAWTAEENRHGDLLNKYLWMTGKVDMKAIEKTINYLIGSGMNPKTDNNPYLGYLYTSFQERATRISHGNTARLAAQYGDKHLGKICRFIAADEARHETAYKLVVSKLFELDPEGTMHCYEDMMKKQIVMPAHLMYDGENDNLWNEFSGVTEQLGVYTAHDYADIMEHCNQHWKIADRDFKGDAGKSQEYVLKLPNRIRKLAEMADKRKKKLDLKEARISWVFNRPTKY